MKRLILTGSFIAVASLVSYGQSVMGSNQAAPAPRRSGAVHQAATPEATADKNVKLYQKQLGLTADQSKRVYDLELLYAKQNQTIMENGGPTQAQANQMQMAKDQQIKSVLTADQSVKYESIKPKFSAAPGN